MDAEPLKSDIEKELQGLDDFIVISRLESHLKKAKTMAIKRFILLKMVEVYTKKNMLSESARSYDALAQMAATTQEKVDMHIKEAELYIQAANYELADRAMNKAIYTGKERNVIVNAVKDLYFKQGDSLEKAGKPALAAKLYEKMLTMNLPVHERNLVQEKLVFLYEKVGKLKEHFALKKKLGMK